MRNDGRPQFDGSDDAPMAAGSLCSECGEIEKHRNHATSNASTVTSSHRRRRCSGNKLPRLAPLAARRTIEDLYGTPEERKNRRQLRRAMKNSSQDTPQLPDDKVAELLAQPAATYEPKCRHCWKAKKVGFHRGRGSHTFEIEHNSTCISIARVVEAALAKMAPQWLNVTALAVKPSHDQYEVTVLVGLPMSTRSRKRARKAS
jgi:hypothetical protein